MSLCEMVIFYESFVPYGYNVLPVAVRTQVFLLSDGRGPALGLFLHELEISYT